MSGSRTQSNREQNRESAPNGQAGRERLEHKERRLSQNEILMAREAQIQEIATSLLERNKGLVEKYDGVQSDTLKKAYPRIGAITDKARAFEKSDQHKIKMACLEVKKLFFERISSIGAEWKRERDKILMQKNPDEREIIELNKIYGAKISEVVRTAELFINELSNASWISEKVLAEIHERAPEIIAILKQDEELVNTLQWTLGWVESGSLSGSEDKYFGILKKRLASPSPQKEFAWVIMRYLSEDQKFRLCKEFLMENDFRDKTAFLEEGNKYGILGARAIKILSEDEEIGGGRITISKEKLEQYAIHYENMNDFEKAVKQFQPSLGALNPAGEMITLKNTALLGISGLGFMTAGINIFTGLSYGEWRDPIKLLTNEYTIGGALVGATAVKMMQSENMLDILTPASEEKIAQRNRLRKKFLTIMNRPVWSGDRGFFTKDTHISAFASFVYDQMQKNEISEDTPLSQKFFTKKRFQEFLEDRKNDNPEYSDIINEFEKNTASIRDNDILDFANIFRELKISGPDPNAVSRFNQEFETAHRI